MTLMHLFGLTITTFRLLGGGWALTESKERTIKMDDGQQITLMTILTPS